MIGEFSKMVGMPITTIRYYERRGLLRPARRTAGRFRLYDHHRVHLARFIHEARSVGLTLEDIGILADLRERYGKLGSRAVRRRFERILEARLARIEREMAGLRRTQMLLRRALGLCRKRESKGCPLLRMLLHDLGGE